MDAPIVLDLVVVLLRSPRTLLQSDEVALEVSLIRADILLLFASVQYLAMRHVYMCRHNYRGMAPWSHVGTTALVFQGTIVQQCMIQCIEQQFFRCKEGME